MAPAGGRLFHVSEVPTQNSMVNENNNKEPTILLSELTRFKAAAERREAELQDLLKEQDDGRRALLHMLKDVEAQKARADELRREWVDAFDAVQDAIFIHDAGYRIVRANRAYAELAGEPFETLIGRPYWELFPRQDGPLATCREALEKALHCEGGGTEAEEELTLPDGRSFQSRSFTLCTAEGGYRHSIHILEDVTENRCREAERRQLAEALRHASSGIVILDPEFTIRYANKALCDLLGCVPENLVGQPLSDLIPPERRDRIPQIKRAVDEHGEWHGEVSLLASDDTEIPLQLAAGAVSDANGTVIDYVGSYSDLRQLKVAQRRTESLRQVIEDLSMELDLDELGQKAVTAALQMTDGEFAGVALRDDSSDSLRYRWIAGPEIDNATRTILGQPFDPEQGLSGEIFQSGKGRFIDDYPHYSGRLPEFVRFGTRQAGAVPIWLGGEMAGVLTIATRSEDTPDIEKGCMPLLEAIARQLGMALQRDQLMRRVQQERDRLQRYLDVAEIMFLALDKEGRVTLINRRGAEILGYPVEEIIGKKWIEHFVPESEQTELDGIFTDSIGGQYDRSLQHENYIQTREGLRYIAWSNAPLKDDAGNITGVISSGTDVTEQRRMDTLFRAITEQAGEGLSLADTSGNYQLVNPAFCSMVGYSEEELLRLNVRDLVPRGIELQLFPRAAQGEAGVRELPLQRKDGSTFEAEIKGYPITIGTDHLVLGFVRDITGRKEAEARQQALTRTLQTLTACNSALVHAADEPQLVEAICRIIVETGGYRMAWIGYAEQDANKTVRNMAAAGEGQDFIDSLGLTWDPERAHGCPTCQTLNSGEASIEQVIAAGPTADEPWRQAALERGFRSMAVLPLTEGERVFGALTFFAAEPHVFSADEIRLLLQLAEDLAYGIGARREQARREQAEQAVKQSEERLRKMVQTMSDGLVLLDKAGCVLFANAAALQMFNRSAEELIGQELGYPVVSDETFELQLPGAGGRALSVEARLSDADWQGRPASVLTLHDISSRHQLEVEREEHVAVLERTMLETVQSLATAVEKRDPYTAGHQRRVAELAAAIAGEMGLEKERILGIRLGGTIHDIGKIYIPAEILNRPGKLSENEFGLIKAHPQVGYEIIKGVEFPWPVAEMVYQHHERLDGSGYPQGLKGDEITLEARILAVADVVEAITSHRPYRAALGIEVGLEEIRKNRGKFYDPEAVDACLRLFEEERFAWDSQ
ncbi:MAG: PAS domain S-box protein [Gammaproteobacteria bacterium]|nr:PAS domain S-box protein [Gammaproteobacteria bacterium]